MNADRITQILIANTERQQVNITTAAKAIAGEYADIVRRVKALMFVAEKQVDVSGPYVAQELFSRNEVLKILEGR